MNAPRQPAGRLQLILLAIVFFGPLAIAAWLYYGGYFQGATAERTNHGSLLEPIVSLPAELPDSPLHSDHHGSWVLLYMNTDSCGDSCREALYTQRQSRKMLGREMDRVERIFLHGDEAPDTVFLAREHEDLATAQDSGLAGLLTEKKPARVPAGGFFLIDPLGNLVMYFPPDIDPANMVDDMKHLLRLSRIG